MNIILDSVRVISKWTTEPLNVSVSDKKSWMEEYAKMHQLDEKKKLQDLRNEKITRLYSEEENSNNTAYRGL